MEKEHEVTLAEGLTAKIVVKGCGQNEPRKNDLVQVEGALILPAGEESEMLESSLCFGDRVVVLEQSLEWHWGKTSKDKKGREIKITRFARTWRKAQNLVQNELDKELNKIKTALKNRSMALKNAGRW